MNYIDHLNSSQNHNINPLKLWFIIQIPRNDRNKLKLRSRRNRGQFKWSSEFFVFLHAIQKQLKINIDKNNFLFFLYWYESGL
jgi:hypothetical protein